MSAAARAAHGLVDHPPHLIDDDVARALCDALPGPSPLDYQRAHPDQPLLAAARLSAVTRSAFAEQRLTRSGLDQYVVLGAGLDTSAHRHAADTWLVDRGPVLDWRAQLFAAAARPDRGRPVPCDLAEASAVDALLRHGLDPDRPVFVAWLGVSMYLDRDAIQAQLADLARLAPGSMLVFDYVLPPALRDGPGAAYAEAVSAATGATGEPWRYTPAPDEVSAALAGAGWRTVEDATEGEAAGPGFWPRTDALSPMGLIRLRHAVLGSQECSPAAVSRSC
ncbi:S-adenosyl-L-methionine-dependent methyltransferase [Cellulomonas denverensis]|uniref:S-adenosyl-L-methionine-dependent methyltransferase n=2 Tax=Cellulomonas denverensis TaxID=264297 RepID=A0A7X6KTY4_9CELL|nr:class I SAM-dependent methyltransferase [Cellulomonas denverensis]GIG26924.1 S-adenosyl-L-methionine-dependent methyltransferase [Cellulomonas denverensis]